MSKLVSVIMSCYNEKEKWVKSSIESIINQTYSNLEIIVVLDNPHNDSIAKVLEYYEEADNRVKVIRNEENMGLAMSLNRGIMSSKGAYIARMDADDISVPKRIEKQIALLEEENLDLVFGNCTFIDEDGCIIGAKSPIPTRNELIRKLLPYGNVVVHPTVIMRRAALDITGLYRNFKTSQDYDLWLRFLSSGLKLGAVNESLLYYRIRKNSISSTKRYQQWLTSEFQRYLYFEREKTGQDSFSDGALQVFFVKNRLYREDHVERFNRAYAWFEQGISLIKRGAYVNGFFKVSFAVLSHRQIMNQMLRILKYRWTLVSSQRIGGMSGKSL